MGAMAAAAGEKAKAAARLGEAGRGRDGRKGHGGLRGTEKGRAMAAAPVGLPGG